MDLPHFLQCHFEWQQNPKFLLATACNPLSPQPLPKGSVPVLLLLLLTKEKVKDFTGSSTSVKPQALIESHLEPSHSAPPSWLQPSRKDFNFYTSSIADPTVAKCSQSVSYPRGVQFPVLMRPDSLNPVMIMTSVKVEPHLYKNQPNARLHVISGHSYLVSRAEPLHFYGFKCPTAFKKKSICIFSV